MENSGVDRFPLKKIVDFFTEQAYNNIVVKITNDYFHPK